MENSLALLDGKILLVGSIGIAIGWLISWMVARRATNQLLAQAESEVEAKAANIDALKHDLTLRERTISEQKESLATLTEEKKGQAASIERQEADINDLTSKIELLDSTQSESGDAIAVLEDTVAELEEKIFADKRSMDKLRENHAQQTKELESKISHMADQVHKSEQTGNELTSELAAANQELGKLRLEASAKHESEQVRAAPVKQLRDQLAQINQLRANDQGEIEKLQSSLTIWQSRTEKAESELTRLQAIIQRNNASSEAALKPDRAYEKLLLLKEEEISVQKTQTHEAQAKLFSVREAMNAKEKEIVDLKVLLQKQEIDSKRELTSLQRKFEEQKLSTDKVTKELATQRQVFEEKSAAVDSHNSSIERRLAEANVNIDELNEGNKSLLRESNQLSQSIRNQQEEIKALVTANRDLELQLSLVGDEKETSNRQLNNLQREIQAKHNAIDTLKSTLARSEQQQHQLESQLKACEQQLEEQISQAQAANQAPKRYTQRPDQVDDLKKIKGIGPTLEKLLNELGIYQFGQLAALNDAEIAWVDEHIEAFKGRIYREQWVQQANALLS